MVMNIAIRQNINHIYKLQIQCPIPEKKKKKE